MSSVARRIAYGVLGGMATKVTRRAINRALHDPDGAPRLPRAAKRDGFAIALVLAAAAGVVLALSDILREQRKDLRRRI